MKIDFRKFIPKEVYAIYGENSGQFVSDNIIKVYNFIEVFFTTHYKELDSNVERVEIVVNNWYDESLIKILGRIFNWRGLRTFKYISDEIAKGIKVATMSQHIGGSTNAIDFNVILYFKGGKTMLINSSAVYDLITKNEKVFIEAGLTTLEDKTITVGWVHGDCRFTGLNTLYIVKP